MEHRLSALAPVAALGLLMGASSALHGGGHPPDEFVSDRLSIVTRGKGPDIILIPGLAAHRDVWSAVAERLHDRYRLHLVQVNGFAGVAPGRNVVGPVAAPVAEEVARYVHEAGLQPPAVIGHSFGGTIGLMLAARHPDIVGRLMVVDVPPFVGVAFGGTTSDDVRWTADRIRSQILADASGSPTDMLEQMTATMTRTDSKRSVLLQYVRDSHRPTVANAFHEQIMTDLRPALARITAPTTVLYVIAPNVPIPPEQYDASMRLAFAGAPHTRFVKIEDSNHYIQIDQPARFATEVEAFMRP